MGVEFQGDPPYDLAPAQSAEAQAVDETVELTLRVIVPGKLPSPAPIRVQMTVAVAMALRTQLGSAVIEAEKRARGQ